MHWLHPQGSVAFCVSRRPLSVSWSGWTHRLQSSEILPMERPDGGKSVWLWGEKFFPTMYPMLAPRPMLFCVMPGNLSHISPTPSRSTCNHIPARAPAEGRRCRQMCGFAQFIFSGHLMQRTQAWAFTGSVSVTRNVFITWLLSNKALLTYFKCLCLPQKEFWISWWDQRLWNSFQKTQTSLLIKSYFLCQPFFNRHLVINLPLSFSFTMWRKHSSLKCKSSFLLKTMMKGSYCFLQLWQKER